MPSASARFAARGCLSRVEPMRGQDATQMIGRAGGGGGSSFAGDVCVCGGGDEVRVVGGVLYRSITRFLHHSSKLCGMQTRAGGRAVTTSVLSEGSQHLTAPVRFAVIREATIVLLL